MRIVIAPETPEEKATRAEEVIEGVGQYVLGARRSHEIIPGNVSALPLISMGGNMITLLHGLEDIRLMIMGQLHGAGVKRMIQAELEINAANAKEAKNGKSSIIARP